MRSAIVLGTILVVAACGGGSSGPATGNVSGLIKDTADVPLEQVQIEIRNSGTVTIVRSVATNASGMYNAVGLASGAYDVFVQIPTAMTLTTANSVPVTVTGGGTAAADFTFGYQPVSFATHVQPLFTASCAGGGCHANTSPQQGMKLIVDSAYGYIVNVPAVELGTMDRIEPSNPSLSYLIHKIDGTQGTVGGSGARMPSGSPQLPLQTRNMVRRWVANGALNN